MYRKVFLLTAWVAFQAVISWAEVLRDGGSNLVLSPEHPVLFVVHGTRGYDYSSSAKAGIDSAVRTFKSQQWPVIYLNDCGMGSMYLPSTLGASGSPAGTRSSAQGASPIEEDARVVPLTRKFLRPPAFHDHSSVTDLSPYMSDLAPTADICSGDGEHRLRLATRHIFLTGGYFNACARRAATMAIESAFNEQLANRERLVVVLHYVVDGLYKDKDEPGLVSENLSEALANLPARQWNDLFRKGISTDGFLANMGYITYDVKIYVEDQFSGTLRESAGAVRPLLLVRLTTSEALAKDPSAYDRFLKAGPFQIPVDALPMFDGKMRPIQPHPVPVLP